MPKKKIVQTPRDVLISYVTSAPLTEVLDLLAIATAIVKGRTPAVIPDPLDKPIRQPRRPRGLPPTSEATPLGQPVKRGRPRKLHQTPLPDPGTPMGDDDEADA